MERVGLLAPVDFLGLDVGADSGVLLGRSGILGQPSEHLPRLELVGGVLVVELLLCSLCSEDTVVNLLHQSENAFLISSTRSSFSQVKSSTSIVRVS